MHPLLHHRPHPRTAAVSAWLAQAPARARAVLARVSRAADDRGATAIEWAIFALLSLTIAGLVAAAITAAINHRLPGIQ